MLTFIAFSDFQLEVDGLDDNENDNIACKDPPSTECIRSQPFFFGQYINENKCFEKENLQNNQPNDGSKFALYGILN